MTKHFLYTPFTGLGLYNGFRGNRWLRNRIKIFKQFVVPSLMNQTNGNFVLWLSWRLQERSNPQVKELYQYLKGKFEVVFTYDGVCFWDDKYSDEEARKRLLGSLHKSLAHVVNYTDGADTILMTLQPSDDMYERNTVSDIQSYFGLHDIDAVGYKHGYIMNYLTGEVKHYNPKTNPPFFTIKFAKEDFIDPHKHAEFTGPYKSHEYIGDHMRYRQLNKRGFCVGTHGENISTHFNHPYGQTGISKKEIAKMFGISHVPNLKLKISVRKWIIRHLPHGWQRKLRYWFGEKFFSKFYSFIRN